MMNHQDACAVLGLQGHITPKDTKLAYHRAAAKYHPDRNPAGHEMMQMINLAYESLQDFEGDVEAASQVDYGQAVNEALNAVIHLGLNIEICGNWAWVSGDTKPHAETLKAAGYKWASKKLMWYLRPAEYKSFNRKPWDMSFIRQKYGSDPIKNKERAQLH